MQPSYRPRGNLRGKTETRKPRDVNVNFLASEGKKECGGREDEEIRVLPFPIALQCNDIFPSSGLNTRKIDFWSKSTNCFFSIIKFKNYSKKLPSSSRKFHGYLERGVSKGRNSTQNWFSNKIRMLSRAISRAKTADDTRTLTVQRPGGGWPGIAKLAKRRWVSRKKLPRRVNGISTRRVCDLFWPDTLTRAYLDLEEDVEQKRKKWNRLGANSSGGSSFHALGFNKGPASQRFF